MCLPRIGGLVRPIILGLRLANGFQGLGALAAAFNCRDGCRHRHVGGPRGGQGGTHRRACEALRRGPRLRGLQLCGGDLRHLCAGEGAVQGFQAQAHGVHGVLGAGRRLRVSLRRGTALGRHVQGGVTHRPHRLHHREGVDDRRVGHRLGEGVAAAALLISSCRFRRLRRLVRELRRRLGVPRRLLCGLAGLLQKGCIVLVLTASFGLAVLLFAPCLFLLAFLLLRILAFIPLFLPRHLLGRRLLVAFASGIATSVLGAIRSPLLHDLLVGVGQLLKVFFVPSLVRMTLHGDQLVGLLDLCIRRTGGHPQDRIRRVLMETRNLVHDLTLEAHLPQDVLVQSPVQLLEMLLAQLRRLLLRLLHAELQLVGQRQVAQHEVVVRLLDAKAHVGPSGRRPWPLQRPGVPAEGLDQLHCHLQLQVVLGRSSSARVAAKAHPAIDQRDLLHRDPGPVPLAAAPEAQQGEALLERLRRVLLKDLLVEPIRIAVAPDQGAQRTSEDLQIAPTGQLEVGQHRECAVQDHLRALLPRGLPQQPPPHLRGGLQA
mmetsp:Transcript_2507/g.5890  ORF Transcript_2507/g.5890 Transcript_2507/m.5890 type:complete len:543 (+) Transcript_2507:688-2316(+)